MTRTCALGVAILLVSSAVGQKREQPGTTWTEEQLRRAVAPARVGKKLTPRTWPGHARVAVCISFDVDNESYLLAAGETSPNTLSTGDFGAQSGLPRVLKLLDKHQIPASFFIPAVSAMLHPEMVPAILKNGKNEIGVHGWIHEYLPALPSAAEEERLLDQAIDQFIAYMKSKPGVWFATAQQIANYVKGANR